MKILLLFPLIALKIFSYSPPLYCSSLPIKDTAVIKHIADGNTSEWPDDKFGIDKETGIQYAVENDKEILFLALRIPDIRTQMKMMYRSMNLYIDTKGKKKENRGIEFPIKMAGEEVFDNQQNNKSPNDFDAKTMRNSMTQNLSNMKLFGFADMALFVQKIQTEGTANIAFAWDSSNVMHIEYSIPLTMLDESPSSLNQKSISIGWKIKAIEIPTDNTIVQTTSRLESRPIGSSSANRPANSVRSSNFPNQAYTGKMAEEQFFWTKYTISL
jgi:hypothetical protein